MECVWCIYGMHMVDVRYLCVYVCARYIGYVVYCVWGGVDVWMCLHAGVVYGVGWCMGCGIPVVCVPTCGHRPFTTSAYTADRRKSV